MSKKYFSELNEIPLYNFEKCLEGDYRFICLNISEKWNVKEAQAFEVVYEKYVQKYQKKELESKFRIYKAVIELHGMYAETQDDYFLTQIEIKKSQLPKVEEKQANDTTQSLVVLSKYMGYRLNPKEITVDEFYSIIKQYERGNKKK